MHSFKTIILLLLFLSLYACEKEFIIITEIEVEKEETIALVNTTVKGNVLNKSTLPLSDINIDLMVNGAIFSSTTTNIIGEFNLENVPANADRSLLIARHPDYATSYQNINIKEDLIQFTDLTLDEKTSFHIAKNELITFTDSNLNLEIDQSQLESNIFSSLTLDINTLNNGELAKNEFFPETAIDSSENLIFLDHQLAFQISIVDNNDKLISLGDDNNYEIHLTNNEYDKESTIWYFDVNLALWKEDNSLFFKDENTIISSKLGLISIAVAKELFIYKGRLVDNNNQPIAFSKVSITDPDNNIVNEVYTNSVGEYYIELPKDISGEITIITNESTIKTIPFNDIQDESLSQIIVNNSFICRDVTLSTIPFSCESVLKPEILFDFDISTYSNFVITIDDKESIVSNSDDEFSGIDWLRLLDNPSPYTIKFEDSSNSAQECSGAISIQDKNSPNAVCLDVVSINFDDGEDTQLVYAEDVSGGSAGVSCQNSITFLIARSDQCNTMCENDDYKPTITFTRDDIGKTISFKLKVTANNKLSSECFGDVIVLN